MREAVKVRTVSAEQGNIKLRTAPVCGKAASGVQQQLASRHDLCTTAVLGVMVAAAAPVVDVQGTSA